MSISPILPIVAGALFLTCPLLDAVVLINPAGITATADNTHNAPFGACFRRGDVA